LLLKLCASTTYEGNEKMVMISSEALKDYESLSTGKLDFIIYCNR